MMGIRNRSVRFFIGLVACVLMIVNLISYRNVPSDIYSAEATYWMIGGIAVFVICSCFSILTEIASISLMVSSFMGIAAFAQAPGTIDYLSTAFFDGFSINAIFALPTDVWLSIFTFILSFVVASVAMFLPFVKEEC